MIDLSHTAAIILAAGRGTRIGSHLPKVLYPLAGKPMVSYILKSLESVGLKDIFVVTGYRSEDVQASINRQAYFVYQPAPLGTGHAVECALKEIPPDINTVVIVNGDDSSFYTAPTITAIIESHQRSQSIVSMVTLEHSEPNGLGRIIRNQKGEVVGIREEKEASDTEKNINEVNIGFYVFNADWIRMALPKIKSTQKTEMYLTDVITLAHSENKLVNTIKLEKSAEWVGVNTQQQLANANHQMVNALHQTIKSDTHFIFDLDDTLIATDKLKTAIESKVIHTVKHIFSSKLSNNKISQLFWETYASHKEKNDWISMPELGEQLAEIYAIKEGAMTFKRLFYTLPFEQHINFGVRELLASLKNKGTRTILAFGDLVYQPIKISMFNNIIDNYHVYEKCDVQAIGEIKSLYQGTKCVMIDDKLETLAKMSHALPQLQTIWLKGGPYQSSIAYQPTFSANSISDVASIINNI